MVEPVDGHPDGKPPRPEVEGEQDEVGGQLLAGDERDLTDPGGLLDVVAAHPHGLIEPEGRDHSRRGGWRRSRGTVSVPGGCARHPHQEKPRRPGSRHLAGRGWCPRRDRSSTTPCPPGRPPAAPHRNVQAGTRAARTRGVTCAPRWRGCVAASACIAYAIGNVSSANGFVNVVTKCRDRASSSSMTIWSCSRS